MNPRVEFVLTSAVVAMLLAMIAFAVVLDGMQVTRWLGSMGQSLIWAPGSALAVLAGAWWSSAWQRRASQRRAHPQHTHGTAMGLTLRTLLLSLLLLPVGFSLWLACGVLLAWLGLMPPYAAGAGLTWLLPFALLLTAAAIVLGIVPAFIIEYFICRRYLHRLAEINTGSA